MSKKIANNRKEVVDILDVDFHTAGILFKDLNFETNGETDWVVNGPDGTLYLKVDALGNIIIKRDTKYYQDEENVSVHATNLEDRFWQFDLHHIIGEAFQVPGFGVERDLTKDEMRRFFNVSVKYLTLLNECPIDLISHINRYKVDSGTLGDLLIEHVKSSIVRFEKGSQIQKDSLILLTKYEDIDSDYSRDKERFEFVLSGMEQIIDRHNL